MALRRSLCTVEKHRRIADITRAQNSELDVFILRESLRVSDGRVNGERTFHRRKYRHKYHPQVKRLDSDNGRRNK